MKFDGSDFERASKDLTDLVADLKDLDLEPLAQRMASITQAITPVRTGRLRESIKPSVTPNKANVHSGLPYAAVIFNMYRIKKRVDEALETEATKAVDKAVGKAIERRNL